METGVYTTTKPGSPTRALLCAAAYLFIALVLAASFTRTRERNPVGARISVRGWPLSFRMPKGFVLDDVMLQIGGELAPFIRVQPDGSTAILAIRRFTVSPDAEPVSLCRELVQGHTGDRPRQKGEPLSQPASAPVGPYAGVEIIDRQRSVLVRVALLGGTVGVSVELVVDGASIDQSLYDVFDQLSRSIQEERV